MSIYYIILGLTNRRIIIPANILLAQGWFKVEKASQKHWKNTLADRAQCVTYALLDTAFYQIFSNFDVNCSRYFQLQVNNNALISLNTPEVSQNVLTGFAFFNSMNLIPNMPRRA